MSKSIKIQEKILNKSTEYNCEYYNNRGLCELEQKKYDEAIKNFDEAIKLNPNYDLAYTNRGYIKAEQKKHDEAILDYNEAIRLDPNCAITHNNRGLSYYMLNLLKKSNNDFNKAIELDPNCALAYMNRGILKANYEKYNDALIDHDKAIQLDLNCFTFYQSEEEKKNLDKFCRIIEKISSNNKNIPKKRKAKKEIITENVWPRDPFLAKQSISQANYKCEYDNSHTSFESEVTEEQYMEAHHLIPMSQQKNFEYTLDTLNNIISLCPNCHKMAHHGNQKSKNKIITFLFNKKIKLLKKSYLDITLDNLLEIYQNEKNL